MLQPQFPVGTNTVTWTVTERQRQHHNLPATVIVRDTQVPVITSCPADVTVNANAGSCFRHGSYLGPWLPPIIAAQSTVTSNAPAQFPVGTNTVTWTLLTAAATPQPVSNG